MVKKSSGHKAIWKYILELSKTDSFKKDVSEIRKKIEIPRNGFKFGKYPELDKAFVSGDPRLFLDEAKIICQRYHLYPDTWGEVILYYILYNVLSDFANSDEQNLCLTTYSKRISANKEEDDYFPISIKVSPFASKRDIIDYIKKDGRHIKFLQDSHLKTHNKGWVKIGKIKSKSPKVQERYDFIYKHRNLPYKKLVSMVNNKFYLTNGKFKKGSKMMGQNDISKIISSENKRRKKVYHT